MSKRNARASDRVAQAINEAGWTPACDGLVATCWWQFEHRAGRGPYRFLDVLAGQRKVQVSVSPSGRSVRVFVDGVEV